METISLRLAPETSKKLHLEAGKLSETCGETVTISDLVRACIGEKLPQVCTKVRSERAGISELRDEVAALREDNARLQEDVTNLVQTLSKIFPLLSTREQIDALTEAIEAVFKALRER
ncbi:hypothetical protein [Geomonas azotofigens]|uniref:hypothetical protein n=1 Tax=Geomonas azotofigens TaxID=2843196 RepID=UPI001C11AA9E|nr:hypothetical protein [Geomonas azotofigens]MBU5613751.1 hypothetical protein [Geomonas azotofigens]